jgi:hypothetical protein
MRLAHIPRHFATLFIILLVAAFLTGNVMVFTGVHAAPEEALSLTASVTPVASPSATPTATPPATSADTTGILILGILLVAVILIGLLWGGRVVRR